MYIYIYIYSPESNASIIKTFSFESYNCHIACSELVLVSAKS